MRNAARIVVLLVVIGGAAFWWFKPGYIVLDVPVARHAGGGEFWWESQYSELAYADSWGVLYLHRRVGTAYPETHWRTLEEAYRIGVQSLPVLLTISVFVGTNLSLQGWHAFQPLGGQRMVGMFVALAGTRELAPIIAASMVAAKAGTEMAAFEAAQPETSD